MCRHGGIWRYRTTTGNKVQIVNTIVTRVYPLFYLGVIRFPVFLYSVCRRPDFTENPTMSRASHRASAARKAKKHRGKTPKRLEVLHTTVVPRDPVVTFRALTDGRGELESLSSIGYPAKATKIEPVAIGRPGGSEGGVTVTLSNGIRFDYWETSRRAGAHFTSRMTNFTGRGTYFLARVDSEWTLSPRQVPGNAIGATVVSWKVTFFPRTPMRGWVLRYWLKWHWRDASGRAMVSNLKRIGQIENPRVGGDLTTG